MKSLHPLLLEYGPASIHSTYLSSHDKGLWSEAPPCFMVWAEDSVLRKISEKFRITEVYSQWLSS